MSSKIQKLLKQGINKFNLNQLDESESIFRQILDLNKDNFDALNALGVINGRKGNHLEAKNFFLKTVKLKPNDISVNFNLANALMELGNNSEALVHYEKCDSLKHNNHLIFINHSKCLFNLNRLEESFDTLSKAEQINDSSIEIYYLKSLIFKNLKDLSSALNCLEKALLINSSIPSIWNLKGLIFFEQECFYEAYICFKKAIDLNENYADGYINLGKIFRQTEIYDESVNIYLSAINNINNNYHLEIIFTNLSSSYIDLIGNRFGEDYTNAIKYIKQALEINNKNCTALYNLAICNLYQMNYERSSELFREVISLDPNYTAAYRNLGVLYNYIGEHANSEECIKHTLKVEPDDKSKNLMLAESLLAQNKFDEAWEYYEHRWVNVGVGELKQKPNFSIPEWEPSQGYNHILVWAEQGLGDQLLFSSILPDVLKRFERVTLLIDNRLCKVMKESMPELDVRNISEPIEEKKFQYQISLCSLGRFFRKSIDDFKSNKSFLRVSNDRFQKENKKIRCAISWKSKAGLKSDDKSMNLEQLESIFELNNIEFYNIQYSNEDKEIESLKKNSGIEIKKPKDLDTYNDIYGLLQFIDSCDFVLSTSNSNVHLSGALGKPTYLLIPKAYGRLWYWDNDLDGTNLWYPSVERFSQVDQNNWEVPVKKLLATIKKEF